MDGFRVDCRFDFHYPINGFNDRPDGSQLETTQNGRIAELRRNINNAYMQAGLRQKQSTES